MMRCTSYALRKDTYVSLRYTYVEMLMNIHGSLMTNNKEARCMQEGFSVL